VRAGGPRIPHGHRAVLGWPSRRHGALRPVGLPHHQPAHVDLRQEPRAAPAARVLDEEATPPHAFGGRPRRGHGGALHAFQPRPPDQDAPGYRSCAAHVPQLGEDLLERVILRGRRRAVAAHPLLVAGDRGPVLPRLAAHPAPAHAHEGQEAPRCHQLRRTRHCLGRPHGNDLPS